MSSYETIAEENPEKCRVCGKDLAYVWQEKLMHQYDELRQTRALVEKKQGKINNFLCDCCKEQFDKPVQIKEENYTEDADFTSVIIKEEKILYTEDIQVVTTQDFFKKEYVEFSEEKNVKCNESMEEFLKTILSNYKIREKTFECGICFKSFSLKGNLKTHMRIHAVEKPFKCDKCLKGFTQKGHLKQHIMGIHSKEKPFKCRECLKAFALKVYLTRHMRRHSGEKPIKCEICSKVFTVRGNLKRHMMIHSGEKPFQCEICPKAFRVKGNLSDHISVHTGNKPFKCGECLKMFLRKKQLTTHERKHKA